jgi:hypothetical protein
MFRGLCQGRRPRNTNSDESLSSLLFPYLAVPETVAAFCVGLLSGGFQWCPRSPITAPTRSLYPSAQNPRPYTASASGNISHRITHTIAKIQAEPRKSAQRSIRMRLDQSRRAHHHNLGPAHRRDQPLVVRLLQKNRDKRRAIKDHASDFLVMRDRTPQFASICRSAAIVGGRRRYSPDAAEVSKTTPKIPPGPRPRFDLPPYRGHRIPY